MAALKVYSWIGIRSSQIREEFPDTDPWRIQTREIVAAPSKAAVGRLVGEDPRSLHNLSETGNARDMEVALAEPGVVFWKPLDDHSGRWARA